MTEKHRSRLTRLLTSALLAVLVGVLYGRTAGFGLVYDDEHYLLDNGVVARGLTRDGLLWAFTSPDDGYLVPAVFLSFMTETSLLGFDPGVFHVTNVLLHAANVVLLFQLLLSLTGAWGRSALAAALLAVHPLHVESVAWISERKDVLSTLFMLSSAAAYVHARRRPRRGRMAVVTVGFVLALLSKPSAIVLPFLLLVLDWWPLGRLGVGEGWSRAAWRGPAGEKTPLFLAALAHAVVTLYLVIARGFVTAFPAPGPLHSVGVSLAVLAHYLEKSAWPARLAVSHVDVRNGLPAGQVLISGGVLACLSVPAVAAARRLPVVLAGWLWYLIALVPVAAFPGLGTQPFEDHYAYVPLVGVYLALAWGVLEAPAPRWRRAGIAAATCAVAALVPMTWAQVASWRDGRSLFEHALRVTSGNYVAHYGLGKALAEQGRAEEAEAHYREAIRLAPDFAEARNNLGVHLARSGRREEAALQFREAVSRRPRHALAWYNLGLLLDGEGKRREAVECFREAVRLKPSLADAWNNLGVSLAGLGDASAAAESFRRALAARPDHAEARRNLDMLTSVGARPAGR